MLHFHDFNRELYDFNREIATLGNEMKSTLNDNLFKLIFLKVFELKPQKLTFQVDAIRGGLCNESSPVRCHHRLLDDAMLSYKLFLVNTQQRSGRRRKSARKNIYYWKRLIEFNLLDHKNYQFWVHCFDVYRLEINNQMRLSFWKIRRSLYTFFNTQYIHK